MIDLNQLVSKRAKALAQSESEWIDCYQSPDFELVCSRLSDGDIEQLIFICSSAEDLRVLVDSLALAIKEGSDNAFTIWKDRVKDNGLSLQDGVIQWKKNWQQTGDFAACLKKFGHVREKPKLRLAHPIKSKMARKK